MRAEPVRAELPITYGRALARCFYTADAPSLLVKPFSRTQLAVTRVTERTGLRAPSASVRPERAFTVAVHLIDPDFRKWGTWVDGQFVKVKSWVAGGIGIFDLESDPRALRDTAFDCVHYNVPRTTLDAFTEDAGLPTVGTLHCEQGTKDVVLYHLTQMLLPDLGTNHELSDLFLDHLVLMVCGRLVDAYGSIGGTARLDLRGLTSWQIRRVRELMGSSEGSGLRLAKLAEECGLSVSQFARSFKRSFGSSAHRYLILRRVETAKSLLRCSNVRLAEISLQAGFPDQAAFSRTFRAIVGTTPAKWRMQHGRRSTQDLDTAGPTEASLLAESTPAGR
jgi:AraC family transcriptional regulator